MEKPLISVIMGVYNDEKYLAQAIDSILYQTHNNIEFIICDDCSTDSSKEIVYNYAKKDSRIIFLKNDYNMGLAATLNRCLSKARGEYIARMDSDDISLASRLERELLFLINNNYDVVGCKCSVIDEKNHIYREMLIHEGDVSLLDAIKKVQIAHPTVLMKSSAIKKVGGYSVNSLTQRAEDYDLWCKLLFNNYKIFGLNENLFLYREGKNGLSKRKYKYRIQEAKLKFIWMRKCNAPLATYLYIFKPLIVGLLPQSLVIYLKGIR